MRQCSIFLVVGACSALLFLGQAAGAPQVPTVVLYDQYDNQGAGTSHTDSQDFEPANDALDNQAADDFVVPAGQIWSITGVDVDGEYDASGPADSVHVYFYSNDGNLPGALLASRTSNPYTNGAGAGDLVITLSSPVVLAAGTYWLSVQARQDLAPTGRWFWHNRTVQSNQGAAWQNPGGGYGPICTNWTRRDICPSFVGDPNRDQVFRLRGTSAPYVTLYNQYDNEGPGAINSQDFEPAYDSRDDQAADDFVVPAGQSWSITGVDVKAANSKPRGAASISVYFYANGAGNLPGALVASRLFSPYEELPGVGPDVVISFGSAVVLTAGTYWLSVQARQDLDFDNQWYWRSRTVQSNQGAVWRNPGGAFGGSCTSWTRTPTCVGGAFPPDQVFRLGGAVANPPTAVRLASLSAKRTPAGVAVSWRTGAETNVLGFDLWRRADTAGRWTKLNARLIRTHGPGSAYRYLDRTARPGIRYAYKLETLRLDGSTERSPTVVVRG
jgi:hypothetical protein